MKFDIETAQNLLEKWKKILRLQDWDIRLMLIEKPWKKTGDIKIDEDDKKAILLLNQNNPKQENIEEVVIHELVHLRLWSLDQMVEQFITMIFGTDTADPKHDFAYTTFMTTLESTTENLTKSFLELGGENKTLSFGRILEKVRDELK